MIAPVPHVLKEAAVRVVVRALAILWLIAAIAINPARKAPSKQAVQLVKVMEIKRGFVNLP